MAFNNIPPNGFPQIPDIEDLEAVVKDVTTLKAAKAAKTDIAPDFSATSNYAVGDLVYHEGTLYVCSTAHAAAAWDANDFTATSVTSELSGVVGDLSDLASTKANQITIAPFFNPEASYEAGDLVYYNGLSYRCTNDHEGAWDAADFAATTIAGEIASVKSGLINVNTIANQCSFDVKTIRATFNAQSKVVSFDVRSNDGFTASTWAPLLTITDSSFAPSSTMFFPIVFINANRDEVVGHGVGKLDTNNVISVNPDDTIEAYSEAVGIVMWQ